jgi:hypothetical protein
MRCSTSWEREPTDPLVSHRVRIGLNGLTNPAGAPAARSPACVAGTQTTACVAGTQTTACVAGTQLNVGGSGRHAPGDSRENSE